LEPRRFDKRSDRPELGESGGVARAIVVEPFRRLRTQGGNALPAHSALPAFRIEPIQGYQELVATDVGAEALNVTVAPFRPAVCPPSPRVFSL